MYACVKIMCKLCQYKIEIVYKQKIIFWWLFIQTFDFGTTFWPEFLTNSTLQPRRCDRLRTNTSGNETCVRDKLVGRGWTLFSCVWPSGRTISRPTCLGVVGSGGGGVFAPTTVVRKNYWLLAYGHPCRLCLRRWTYLIIGNKILFYTWVFLTMYVYVYYRFEVHFDTR